MPPHPILTDILVKFHVQIHQLTPNAFAQFFKYFWAVVSFGGKPSDDGFVKRYELHYQSKKIEVDGGENYQQFGYINFHGRCGGACL
jgi:Ser-tRNA(Ala) deacylase AlaX